MWIQVALKSAFRYESWLEVDFIRYLANSPRHSINDSKSHEI